MSPTFLRARLDALRELRSCLRKSPSRPHAGSNASQGFRPELHLLEDRTVPDAKLSSGLLTITGTAGNDTVLIQQVAGPGGSGDQVAVTLNGQTSTFKASQVNQITASLLAGNDTVTLDESVKRITPPSSFDGAAGTDFLTLKGTAGADTITVTGTTIGLVGAGTVTYSNFESLLVDSLGGNDTATMTGLNAATATTVDGGADNDTFTGTFGTLNGNLTLKYFEPASVTITSLSGHLTVAGGPLTNSNVTAVTATGFLEVSETLAAPNAGLLSNGTFGTISGQVVAGSIVDTTVTTVSPGGSLTAAGQGTTTNVSIGTLSGSFRAPEDANPGSGVMSNTTITSITSTGTVSTGSISGMSVGTTAAGSSITAAGQGTTTNVSIGTLGGSFTAPEDSHAGSGTMGNTTITSITSTGRVSTGSISGMSVGTAAAGSSITAAGQGTITGITIDLLSGLVSAEKDATLNSGTITHAEIGTITSTGRILAGGTVTDLTIITIEGGNFTAGDFELVTATNVTADEVRLVAADATRTLKVSAVSGFALPESFAFSYDGTGSGNPLVNIQVNAGTASNIRYDFSATTDTVGVSGSGIDLVSFTANGKSFLRNIVVAGSLMPAPGTFAVNLPQDSVAVAAAGNIPAGSIKVLSAPAVAAGFFNGIAATNATTGNAAALFAPGTTLVQANDTFQAVAGDGVPVASFLVSGSNFNANNLLFTDQGADNKAVTAAVSVAASSPSAVQQIEMRGEGIALTTKMPVLQAINVLSGSLGDLTLISNQDTPFITAPRIVGNLNLGGRLTQTIQTTAGNLGRAFTNAAGVITGVTTISITAGGGITSTGRIISAGNLVSTIITQSSLDGVIAAQGDIGVIQTDAQGNAVVGTGPGKPLTRFGGITVSTGGMNGSIVALGNVFGDINVGGGWNGRLAVKGSPVAGLDLFRTGILGNVTIGGGINPTGAIVSAGLIGDDGSNNVGNDSLGTKLNITGAVKGIIAAERDINFGSVGNTSQAHIYENVGPASANGTVIAAIFTSGGLDLTIPGGLNLILADLSTLTVGVDGNLTGATP
jgi:fibronectin-binding autotransporter adhesin